MLAPDYFSRANPPRRAANVSGPLPPGITLGGGGGSIPVNSDPNVIGSSTYNPNAGTGNTSNSSGGNTSSSGGGWFDQGFWDDWGWGGGYGGYDDDGMIFNGGYGGGGGGGGSSSSSITPLLTGLGGLAVGSALSRGNAGAVQRNLPAEVAGITALNPGLAGSTVGTGLQLNPLVTAGNVANFNSALGGVAPNLRAGFDAANPALANYTSGLGATLDRINGLGAVRYDPTGYQAAIADNISLAPVAQSAQQRAQFSSAGPAAQATFNPAQAFLAQAERAQATTAAQQRANGGPLLNTLQEQAMQSVGGVSPLQARQQEIALGLLGGSGGDLTAQDLRNVQQDTRGAFAARGLYDGNQAIGAEIMNSDAARRSRLMQNLGIAQQVDAAGQQQIGATRNFALGVQNQGQNLSQFNAGQGNALGQFNADAINRIAALNANNFTDVSKYNAGTQTQNSQFNSQGALQASLANMAARNQMSQFDASGRNANSQFNAGLGTQNNQWNAGAANALNLAGAQLGQNNLQFNALQNNQASGFNAGVTNSANQWNAGAAAQNANDQWARALGLGNFYGSQAINPNAIAMGLLGNAPDYTSALLGYGSDVYGSNANAQSAANISRSNNNAALTAAGLNLLYSLYGRS